MIKTISPNWPSIPNVTAFVTTRENGYSLHPFDSLNLAYHVGDDDNAVFRNRKMFQSHLPPDHECIWLNQTHSNIVIRPNRTAERTGDALITQDKNQFLCIMTADCLPIMMAHKDGLEVANIHVGWKGALNGIIENTIQSLSYSPSEYTIYLGPHICQDCFIVGDDVSALFLAKYPASSDYFKPYKGKFLFHLADFSVNIFKKMKISNIFHSNKCTFEDNKQFFSYRKEGKTGRIVSAIGIHYSI